MTRSAITVERVGRVLCLTLHSPALTCATALETLVEALRTGAEDPAIQAIALLPETSDLLSIAPARGDPALDGVCDQLDASQVPTLIGVPGSATGPGLALVCAAQFRLASGGATVCSPEIGLGLLPGGGLTQRLPRRVGIPVALDWMLSGRSIPASEAETAGLLDGVARGPLPDALLSLARRLGAAGAGPRPVPNAPAPRDDLAEAALSAAQSGLALGPLDAPKALVQAVDLATRTPLPQGLNDAAQLGASLADGPQARALGHLHHARQRWTLAAAVPHPVESIALWGDAPDLPDRAAELLQAGFHVALVSPSPDRLSALGTATRAALSDPAATSRLTGTDSLGATAADLAWLCPDPEVAQMDLPSIPPEMRVVAEGAGPASLWLYPRGTALEVSSDPRSPSAASDNATGLALAARLGRVGIATGATGACLADRLMEAVALALDPLIEEGASPLELDEAILADGHTIRPYAWRDTRGLRALVAARKAQSATRDPRVRFVPVMEHLVDAGRTGRRAGAGFHFHGDASAATDPSVATDQDLHRILTDLRAAAGLRPRKVTQREIRVRVSTALALTGLAILDDGLVQHADIVDLLGVHAGGFPSWRGGPLHHAAAIGWHTMEHWRQELSAEDDPITWAAPEAWLAELALDQSPRS